MTFYTVDQLAAAAGLAPRSIRYHAAKGWLKAEPKTPGVRGLRFAERIAKKWMALHYPTKTLP